MVLVTNKVSGQPPQLEGVSPNNLLGKRNHEVATSLIQQMGDLLSYASVMFTGLLESASATSQRIHNLGARIDNVTQYLPQVESYISQAPVELFKTNLKVEWRPKIAQDAQFFTKQSNTRGITAVYDTCLQPPNLDSLNEFNEDGSSCLKKYTNPYFFIDEWVAEQERQREKAKENRRKKREDRKKNRGGKNVGQTAQTEVEVGKMKRRRYDPLTGQLIEDSSDAGAEVTPNRRAKASVPQVMTSSAHLETPAAQPQRHATPARKVPSRPVTSAPAEPAPNPPMATGGPKTPARSPRNATAAPTPLPRETAPPPANIPPPIAVNTAPSVPASRPSPGHAHTPPHVTTGPPPPSDGPPPPNLAMMSGPPPPSDGPPPPSEVPPAISVSGAQPEAKSGLLAQIHTGIKLKKAAERQVTETAAPAESGGAINVAAILQRRIAIADSDSEGDGGDSDWENEDEWSD